MPSSMRQALAALVCMASMASAWAQGGFGYTLLSTGDYTNHAVSGRLTRGDYWGSLTASSGMDGNTQVDHSAAINAGFAPHRSLDLDLDLGSTLDTSLRTTSYSLGLTWTTPWQVVVDEPLRLGPSWGYTDYALRSGAPASGLLPDQYHWGLMASLPLTTATSLSLQSRWNRYTIDPVTVASQLLQRRRPRVNAAMGLADFADIEHRATVNWRSASNWRWAVGGSYGQTVIGQSTRNAEASLEVPWNLSATIGMGIQHLQSDEVRRPNGQLLLPFQTSNSVSLSLNWSWK